MKPELSQRLAETVAWCSRHANVVRAGTSTRTLAFMPPLLQSFQGYDLLKWLGHSPEQTQIAVEFVCKKRQQELSRLSIPRLAIDENLAGGRILCTDFNTDSCAAATPASNGYYDEDDIPGWDTWFYCNNNGLLYCWVPPQLIDLATEGMDVIPVECVWWIKSLEELNVQ